jgi:DNA-binding transcriptional LysR family regulator
MLAKREEGGRVAEVVEVHGFEAKVGAPWADGKRLLWMLVIHFCMIHEPPWDLYRTFEAVARQGSLTAAGRALGISQSTVSRHLAQLEERAGSPLLTRESPVALTARGASLLEALEPMVDAALEARAALEATPLMQGEVTVTTVGEMVRWVLARRLASFYRAYPHLRLRVLANNQLDSLAAGDADVALRLARPKRGKLVARRLHVESFGLFASRSLALGAEVPWLGLTGSLAHIPEQRHADRAFASRAPRLLVEDVESLGLVVEAAMGVAILPRQLAARLEGVVEVRPHEIGARDLGAVPSREVWMVVHRGKQRVPKVRAVMQWLRGVFDDDA